MTAREKPESTRSQRRQPATTPEEREQQMIELADALAEKQMLEGTASSQVITHYLKLGTSRERLEQERLRRENLLLEEKRNLMASQAKSEEMLNEVLKAIKTYNGADDDEL